VDVEDEAISKELAYLVLTTLRIAGKKTIMTPIIFWTSSRGRHFDRQSTISSETIIISDNSRDKECAEAGNIIDLTRLHLDMGVEIRSRYVFQ